MAEIFGNTTATPLNPKKFSGGDNTNKMDKFGEVEITDTETLLRVSTHVLEIDGNNHLKLKGGQILLVDYGGSVKVENGVISTSKNEFNFVEGVEFKTPIPIRIGSPTDNNHAATKEYVDNSIGDISTALDELHAYAQALVTGGATE